MGEQTVSVEAIELIYRDSVASANFHVCRPRRKPGRARRARVRVAGLLGFALCTAGLRSGRVSQRVPGYRESS
jgi:hypothetical protein